MISRYLFKIPILCLFICFVHKWRVFAKPVTNNEQKERDSLKASIISLNPSIFHGVIADKFQAEQTLSEKLNRLASSLLENNKLLNDIILFHRHCFAALYTECK